MPMNAYAACWMLRLDSNTETTQYHGTIPSTMHPTNKPFVKRFGDR